MFFIECVGNIRIFMSENSNVFNLQDEIFCYLQNKSKFYLYFCIFIGYIQCLTHKK